MLALLAATLILHDARVFVGPGRYADAVAVEGERIVKVGDNASVLELKGPETKTIDLDGRTVTPGFNDAHVRFPKGGALQSLLEEARRSGVTSIQGPLTAEEVALLAELAPSLRVFGWGELDKLDEAERLRRLAKAPVEIVGAFAVLDGKAPLVKKARRRGFQPILQAAGPQACPASKKPLPACKLELLEAVNPDDLKDFRALGVIASVQPGRGALPLRSLERAGAVLAFGSGWPERPLHPRETLIAATTRQDGESVSLERAVSHYTLGCAAAVQRQKDLGTIEPGKLADLAVWDRDLFKADSLREAEIDMTIFGGKVVFERAAQ